MSRRKVPATRTKETSSVENAVRDLDGSSCESVSLEVIAREVGTPCYVYSSAAIREQYNQLRDAVRKLDARLHYSVKANSSITPHSFTRSP